MSEEKHTPVDLSAFEGHTKGPWIYRPEEFDDWGVVRFIPAGEYELSYDGPIMARVNVNTVHDKTQAEFRRRRFEDGERCDPVESDARLIAAAPFLAEEVRLLREALAPLADLLGLITECPDSVALDEAELFRFDGAAITYGDIRRAANLIPQESQND